MQNARKGNADWKTAMPTATPAVPAVPNEKDTVRLSLCAEDVAVSVEKPSVSTKQSCNVQVRQVL